MRFQIGDRVEKINGNCVWAYATVVYEDAQTVRIVYDPGCGRERDSTYHHYLKLIDPYEFNID